MNQNSIEQIHNSFLADLAQELGNTNENEGWVDFDSNAYDDLNQEMEDFIVFLNIFFFLDFILKNIEKFP